MTTKVKREVLGPFKTPNRNLLYYDDRDGRKFLREMLVRLGDSRRLDFVRWCARSLGNLKGVGRPIGVAPDLVDKTKLIYSVVSAENDLSMLTVGATGNGGLDADVVLAELNRRVRAM